MMDTNERQDSASASDAATATTTTPIRQEEQGQQSQQDVSYASVDFGSCWYHEDAVTTGGK